MRLTFENVLSPDRYQSTVAIARPGYGLHWIDHREAFVSFVVSSPRAAGGLVDLPVEVEMKHVDAAVREEASA